MALPVLTPPNNFMVTSYEYEVVSCAHNAVRSQPLAALGFAPVNGILEMMPIRYNEVIPALGGPAIQVHPGGDHIPFEPFDLELKSTLYQVGTQDTFRAAVQSELAGLAYAAQGYYDEAAGWTERHLKHNYLRVDTYHGSGYYGYYVYANYLGMETKPVWKTQHSVLETSIYFRVVDPTWYGSQLTVDIDVTGGGPTAGVIPATAGKYGRCRRMCIFVYNNAVSATYYQPHDVTITNQRGDVATFTGQLTANDEYWKLDCMEGRLYRGTSYVTETDVTGSQFSGDFMSSDVGADSFSVEDADTSSFKTRVYYRRRYS